jgi:hypothetical protein
MSTRIDPRVITTTLEAAMVAMAVITIVVGATGIRPTHHTADTTLRDLLEVLRQEVPIVPQMLPTMLRSTHSTMARLRPTEPTHMLLMEDMPSKYTTEAIPPGLFS